MMDKNQCNMDCLNINIKIYSLVPTQVQPTDYQRAMYTFWLTSSLMPGGKIVGYLHLLYHC